MEKNRANEGDPMDKKTRETLRDDLHALGNRIADEMPAAEHMHEENPPANTDSETMDRLADISLVAFNRVAGYEPLRDMLHQAYQQAAVGKGADRHAGGLEFLNQPIMTEIAHVGTGGALFQIRKKAKEAVDNFESRGPEWARDEMLGVIVYAAALAIHFQSSTLEGDDDA
jgi:hypothetical protein